MHAKDRERRAVQGQKCVRCCCSCVKRRCDQVGTSSAAPMRRLALGEGKSWVEDGAGWWGWSLLRGSQRDHHDHGSLVAQPQGGSHDILPTLGPQRCGVQMTPCEGRFALPPPLACIE